MWKRLVNTAIKVFSFDAYVTKAVKFIVAEEII